MLNDLWTRTRQLSRTARRTTAILLVAIPGVAVTATATPWNLTFELENGGGDVEVVQIGVHPEGTAGVDTDLGETCLPPWPPSPLFDARFMIPDCNGLEYDVRDTTHVEREYLLRWQEGDGGYPITLRWDLGTLPYASIEILDGYGGLFLPPINAFQVDSLVVPDDMDFVSQLAIRVIPGVSPDADPVLDDFLDAQIFAGQQFPEYSLDDLVFDPDTPDPLLNWYVTGHEPLLVDIDGSRILRFFAPPGFIGTRTVEITVVDPEGNSDQDSATLIVSPTGAALWDVPLKLTNGIGEITTVTFAMHPDGTDGIDSGLGEVALPPWPPSDVFDSRMLLPDSFTHAYTDIRGSSAQETVYTVEFQAGAGDYPMTIEWDPSLPLGSFSMSDRFGGVFIPAFSMGDQFSLVIPPAQDFVDGVEIAVLAAEDTTPPVGPLLCQITEVIPGVSVELQWDQCIEDNFAYYEVLYSSLFFTLPEEAETFWDYTEDANLTSITTLSTIIPVTGDVPYFRVRAWDLFGNVGALSEFATTGIEGNGSARAGTELMVAPNPVRLDTRIAWSNPIDAGSRFGIYDSSGRRLRSWTFDSSDVRSLRWDGRDEAGHRLSPGVYFGKLQSGGSSATARILVVR